jgi:SAM-dependent methyltransferase
MEMDSFLQQRQAKDNPIDYLDDLRRSNFDTCIGVIKGSTAATDRLNLLEIGCGAGIFLESAIQAGFNATGIEPYEAMARRGIKRGLNVRIGLFPDCLGESERFDAIVFNDVFEHLPNPKEMLATCHRHLNDKGILVINIPNSRGLFFRIAALAARVQVTSPWERMWQKMFWSPHLHYFSAKSLELICRKSGFHPIVQGRRLKSVNFRGLWSRVMASPHSSKIQDIALFIGSLGLGAVTPFFESDSTVSVYKKMRFNP